MVGEECEAGNAVVWRQVEARWIAKKALSHSACEAPHPDEGREGFQRTKRGSEAQGHALFRDQGEPHRAPYKTRDCLIQDVSLDAPTARTRPTPTTP